MDSLRRYGISEHTTSLFAIRLCNAAVPEEVTKYETLFKELIQGTPEKVKDARVAELCDPEVVRNNYKLAKDWDMADRSRVLGAIVGALSLRGI